MSQFISIARAQFLFKTMQLTERIFYNENVNSKLYSNNLEIDDIYFYVFRRDNTEFYLSKM